MADSKTKPSSELIDYVLSLRVDRIRQLFADNSLTIGGRTKAELRKRLSEAIAKGELDDAQIVAYLDATEPWGRQHAFIYRADRATSTAWRDTNAITAQLAPTVRSIVNKPLPLALPPELTLSTLRLSQDFVEIVAVEGRSYEERRDDLDQLAQLDDGTAIEYRAYARRVARGMVSLRWDTKKALASLHITQAERNYDYDQSERRFANLISAFLNFDTTFKRLDLRGAVRALAERELAGTDPLTHSRRLGLESPGGRDVDFASASASKSVTGEPVVDNAISGLTAGGGRGRLGNVYWLDKSARSADANPLEQELHTTLIGSESRVHFMRTTSQAEVAYVIGRIRSL